MAKLYRRTPQGDANIKALIADLLENGTNGDKDKWRRAFPYITKDKELMSRIASVDASKAFEQYYLLGEKRSIKRLAKVTGHNNLKLKAWKNKYQWDKKVLQRDLEVATVLKAKTIKEVVNTKLEYCAIINKVIVDMMTNMNEYNEKVAAVNKNARTPKEMIPYKSLIYNADDFERLVKLEMLLRGEATERSESTITEKEKIVERQIIEDPTTRLLLKELYARRDAYGDAAKAIAPQAGRTIDVTEGSKST